MTWAKPRVGCLTDWATQAPLNGKFFLGLIFSHPYEEFLLQQFPNSKWIISLSNLWAEGFSLKPPLSDDCFGQGSLYCPRQAEWSTTLLHHMGPHSKHIENLFHDLFFFFSVLRTPPTPALPSSHLGRVEIEESFGGYSQPLSHDEFLEASRQTSELWDKPIHKHLSGLSTLRWNFFKY